MPSYDSAAEEHVRDWPNRFPAWALGGEIWKRLPAPRLWARERPLDLLPEIRTRDRQGTPLKCPRVFVSHRQLDRSAALRIAWIAKDCGFDYWLDLLDPNLQSLSALNLSPRDEAVATALIIEMGLLNCSHVIAVMTPRTRGTLWVPYEYGRVKDVPPLTIQAGCWCHPDLAAADFPEYLLLGTVTHSEEEVRNWLGAERTRWVQAHGKCHGGSQEPWSGPVPEPPLGTPGT